MKNLFLTENEVNNFIDRGKPLVIRDFKLLRDTENYIVDVLHYYLKSIGKEKIFDHLSYCLRELLGNAKKANTKRVFFDDEKLSIQNPKDYQKGIDIFKVKTISNIQYYLELQEKSGLFVQAYFHIKDPYLNIIISNNSPLVKEEREQIKSKIMHAKTFNSIEEAFTTVLDDTEGAGLGIVIMILMLRRIGIQDKNFAIVQEGNLTHVRIAVPLSLVTEEEVENLSELLIDEISNMPQFPDHIRTLNGLLRQKEVDFREITTFIRKDPGLTIDILKLANSAHYKRVNKIEKVELAVSIIGVKGLRLMLQSHGVKTALEGKYDRNILEQIWKHSYLIAQISSILCNEYNLTEIGEIVYTCALLSDIGKILLHSLHPQAMEKIANFCVTKSISMNIINNLLEGANHFQIGAKMVEKWGVPQVIAEVIRGQTNPFGVTEPIKKITKLVYLSNMIASRINPNENEYLSYESLIAEDFGIQEPEKFQELISKIKAQLSH